MKKVLALVLALVMALSLVACGGKTNPTPDGGDKSIGGTYDITVWVPEAAVELTQKQINDFNSSNEDGITFNATVEPVSEADAGTNMVTDVEAGGDLFFFAQDQFARLVQAGALSQLGVAAGEAVAKANAAGVVAAATSGDSLYAYPLTADNTDSRRNEEKETPWRQSVVRAAVHSSLSDQRIWRRLRIQQILC